MVLNYEKTIAGAFRDASDALIVVKKQRVVREEQEKLVAAAEDATRLARIRYQGGATSYLEVLTTDSRLFTARLNLVSSREGQAQSLVQLYEALGGIVFIPRPRPHSHAPPSSQVGQRLVSLKGIGKIPFSELAKGEFGVSLSKLECVDIREPSVTKL